MAVNFSTAVFYPKAGPLASGFSNFVECYKHSLRCGVGLSVRSVSIISKVEGSPSHYLVQNDHSQKPSFILRALAVVSCVSLLIPFLMLGIDAILRHGKKFSYQESVSSVIPSVVNGIVSRPPGGPDSAFEPSFSEEGRPNNELPAGPMGEYAFSSVDSASTQQRMIKIGIEGFIDRRQFADAIDLFRSLTKGSAKDDLLSQVSQGLFAANQSYLAVPLLSQFNSENTQQRTIQIGIGDLIKRGLFTGTIALFRLLTKGVAKDSLLSQVSQGLFAANQSYLAVPLLSQFDSENTQQRTIQIGIEDLIKRGQFADAIDLFRSLTKGAAKDGLLFKVSQGLIAANQSHLAVPLLSQFDSENTQQRTIQIGIEDLISREQFIYAIDLFKPLIKGAAKDGLLSRVSQGLFAANRGHLALQLVPQFNSENTQQRTIQIGIEGLISREQFIYAIDLFKPLIKGAAKDGLLSRVSQGLFAANRGDLAVPLLSQFNSENTQQCTIQIGIEDLIERGQFTDTIALFRLLTKGAVKDGLLSQVSQGLFAANQSYLAVSLLSQ